MNRRVSSSVLLLLLSTAASAQGLSALEKAAAKSLEANLVTLRSETYLAAGPHQFHALWTRDFCFSARALVALGRADALKDQLDLLLGGLRADGLAPSDFGSATRWQRRLSSVLRKPLLLQDPVAAEYGEGGEAVDSNALLLLAALDYLDATQDQAWWNSRHETLVKVYRYYDSLLKDGLIQQGEFADWQDSVKRRGKTFYANLLYYVVSEQLADDPAFEIDPKALAALKARITETFLDKDAGVFRSIAGEPYVSLEGNLLAIDLGFFPPSSAQAQSLYAQLKRHPLWLKNDGLPGWATAPDYPDSWIAWEPRLVGLRHYHDRLYWSWLMGLSAKVAAEMGDLAASDRILSVLATLAKRDGAIAEVYEDEPPFAAVHTWLYTSEQPFSWGAAMVLDAVKLRKKRAR